MKRFLLLLTVLFLLSSCERRIKDYTKYISASFLHSQSFVFAPFGIAEPAALISADSTLLGITPCVDSSAHSLLVQPQGFIAKKNSFYYSPGYFRIENKAGEKCEIAVSQSDFLMRIQSFANEVKIQLADSSSTITNNQITTKLNGHFIQISLRRGKISQDKNIITLSSDNKMAMLIHFSLKENSKPNWTFEHYYLNTLQEWNRTLNAFKYKAKNAKTRGPFYTAVYKAIKDNKSSSHPPNTAELLLQHIQTNSNTQFVLGQLGLLYENEQFYFTKPTCKSAVIEFSNPVHIINNSKNDTCTVEWNFHKVKSLTAAQLLSGGTLIFN